MQTEILELQYNLPHVLVVCTSEECRQALLDAVAQADMLPILCESLEEAFDAIQQGDIRVVSCDDRLPPLAVEAIVDFAQKQRKPIPVVVTSRTGEWEEFLQALRLGAFDYLALPPRLEEVRRVLGLAVAESRRIRGNGTNNAGPQEFRAREYVLGLGDTRFEHATFASAQLKEMNQKLSISSTGKNSMPDLPKIPREQ